MKPTLHRSIIFWAGILVLIFTCWAWRDSYTHVTRLIWNQFTIASGARGICIGGEPLARQSLTTERETLPTYPANWPRETFPSPFLLREKEAAKLAHADPTTSFRASAGFTVAHNGRGAWSLYLPYWIILSPLIITWFALLFLRARRLKRAQNNLTTPS